MLHHFCYYFLQTENKLKIKLLIISRYKENLTTVVVYFDQSVGALQTLVLIWFFNYLLTKHTKDKKQEKRGEKMLVEGFILGKNIPFNTLKISISIK